MTQRMPHQRSIQLILFFSVLCGSGVALVMPVTAGATSVSAIEHQPRANLHESVSHTLPATDPCSEGNTTLDRCMRVADPHEKLPLVIVLGAIPFLLLFIALYTILSQSFVLGAILGSFIGGSIGMYLDQDYSFWIGMTCGCVVGMSIELCSSLVSNTVRTMMTTTK